MISADTKYHGLKSTTMMALSVSSRRRSKLRAEVLPMPHSPVNPKTTESLCGKSFSSVYRASTKGTLPSVSSPSELMGESTSTSGLACCLLSSGTNVAHSTEHTKKRKIEIPQIRTANLV